MIRLIVSAFLLAFVAACGGGDDASPDAPLPAETGEDTAGSETPAGEPEASRPLRPDNGQQNNGQQAGAETGQMCGGVAGISCAGENDFCQFAEGQCRMPDAAGTCTARPEACTMQYDPVCGCDGNTYGNDCEASAAGVSVMSKGECSAAGEGEESGEE